MELRQARYFVAVAEELNFGRAARRVHVAQPALSKQVMNLERSIGARLLDRRGRKVEMTEAGRVFLRRARRILESVEEAEEATARAGRGETGHLAVGFTGMSLYGVVPRVARAFGQRYPGVDVEMREMCSDAMAEALLGGRLDVAFLHPPGEGAAGEDLAVEAVMSESLIVALPEGHDLAGLPEVPLALLAEERSVMVPKEGGPHVYDRVLAACRAAGLSRHVTRQSALSQAAVVGLVDAGAGVSLVWESMANLRRPGVVYRPLAEDTPRIETALAYGRRNASPVLAAFLVLAGEFLPETGVPVPSLAGEGTPR